jgi:hypothetical protein
MPRRMALATLFLAFLAVLPLRAQQGGSSLQGVSGTQRVLVPVNLNAATQNVRKNAIQIPQAKSTTFGLSSLIPRISLQGLPKFGSSSPPPARTSRQKKQ